MLLTPPVLSFINSALSTGTESKQIKTREPWKWSLPIYNAFWHEGKVQRIQQAYSILLLPSSAFINPALNKPPCDAANTSFHWFYLNLLLLTFVLRQWNASRWCLVLLSSCASSVQWSPCRHGVDERNLPGRRPTGESVRANERERDIRAKWTESPPLTPSECL